MSSMEVGNGLLGFSKDAFIRLCVLMRSKPGNIRIIIGMAKKLYGWKHDVKSSVGMVDSVSLRDKYDSIIKSIPSNAKFNKIIELSLEARLASLPPHFLTPLRVQIDFCNEVLLKRFRMLDNPRDRFNTFIGDLCLATTRVLEGYMLRLERKIDCKKYTDENLIALIQRKIGYIIKLNGEKNTLNLTVVKKQNSRHQNIVAEKKEFFQKAKVWLKNIKEKATDKQIQGFLDSVEIIEYSSGVLAAGFTSISGERIYTLTTCRLQTTLHELSHALLRYLKLNSKAKVKPTARLKIDTALLISPVINRSLKINGVMTEAGWHFEHTMLGTQLSEGEEWPLFCVEDVKLRDE